MYFLFFQDIFFWFLISYHVSLFKRYNYLLLLYLIKFNQRLSPRVLPFPIIVINLPWTYEKLGEPYRFSGKLDPSEQTVTHIDAEILLVFFLVYYKDNYVYNQRNIIFKLQVFFMLKKSSYIYLLCK